MAADDKTQQIPRINAPTVPLEADRRPHVRAGTSGLHRRGESRVCPLCRAKSHARLCPRDGYLTVDIAARGTSLGLTGSILNGAYLVGERVSESKHSLVYHGTQLSVGRPVVIKVRRHMDARHLRGHARFQRAARVLSAIDHPHVVRLIDLGLSAEGAFFSVLERLHGETLGHLLRTHLAPQHIAAIALNIADGLSAVHAAKVVHRNVGADNIIVLRGRREVGALKLLDFRLVKDLEPPGTVTEAPPVTRSGELVGEPRYLAPEQALGSEITPATDVYALGVLIYEMVTAGRHPFPRKTSAQQAAAAVTDDPAPATFDDRPLKGVLIDLLLRFMHRVPKKRPQDGAAALALLRECLTLKPQRLLCFK